MEVGISAVKSEAHDEPPVKVKEETLSCEGEGRNTVKVKEETLSSEDEEDDWDDEEDEDESASLTHKVAMEKFKAGFAELILGDMYLNDLSSNITLEEVNSLISLEHGQSITVNVRKGDQSVMPVVVLQNGTVYDLKTAIKHYVILKQSRENSITQIAWRYIWKRHWLFFEGQKLAEDQKRLTDYGIKNRDEVTFIKRLRPKASQGKFQSSTSNIYGGSAN